MMKQNKTTMLAAAMIAGASLSSPASAVLVDWSTVGMNEADILSPSGQTFTDFAGISGLTVTMKGSSNNLDTYPSSVDIAPYVHYTNTLHFRTQQVAGDNDPVFMTFTFNRPVTFTSQMFYFGDGSVQEEFRWSTTSGVFDGTVGGDNVLNGDLTSSLQFTSGRNGISDLALISGDGLTEFTIGLGGQNFTGLGGSTISMDIELATVPVPAAIWLFGSGLLGLVGIGRRRQATASACQDK